MDEDKVKQLVEWIAEHLEPDLTPAGMLHSLPVLNDISGLLDKIAELSGIPQEKIGDWINPIRERIEGSRNA